MPGPVLTATIGHTLQRGFWAGPWVVLGHGILELSLVMALFYGLGTYIKQPLVLGVIGVVGGVILLWMGVAMLRHAPRLSLASELQLLSAENQSAKQKGWQEFSRHPVFAGLLTSLSNPYWSLWWATIGLGYVGLSQQLGTPGIISFYGGHILSDLVWYSLVSLGFAWGRTFISDKICPK